MGRRLWISKKASVVPSPVKHSANSCKNKYHKNPYKRIAYKANYHPCFPYVNNFSCKGNTLTCLGNSFPNQFNIVFSVGSTQKIFGGFSNIKVNINVQW